MRLPTGTQTVSDREKTRTNDAFRLIWAAVPSSTRMNLGASRAGDSKEG
jgi:hypothetical protein